MLERDGTTPRLRRPRRVGSSASVRARATGLVDELEAAAHRGGIGDATAEDGSAVVGEVGLEEAAVIGSVGCCERRADVENLLPAGGARGTVGGVGDGAAAEDAARL